MGQKQTFVFACCRSGITAHSYLTAILCVDADVNHYDALS